MKVSCKKYTKAGFVSFVAILASLIRKKASVAEEVMEKNPWSEHSLLGKMVFAILCI